MTIETAVSNDDFVGLMNQQKFKVTGVYKRSLIEDDFELNIHYRAGDFETKQRVISREDYNKLTEVYSSTSIHTHYFFKLSFEDLQKKFKRATRGTSLIRKVLNKL